MRHPIATPAISPPLSPLGAGVEVCAGLVAGPVPVDIGGVKVLTAVLVKLKTVLGNMQNFVYVRLYNPLEQPVPAWNWVGTAVLLVSTVEFIIAVIVGFVNDV